MVEHIASRARNYDKLDAIEEHLHGQSLVYPQLASPITLTSAAGIWAAYPAPTEIVPVNTVVTDFDIHWVSISAISANGDYMLRLYTGAALSEVFLSEFDFYRTAVQSQEGSAPIITVIVRKNTRISAAISSGNAGANTVNVKVRYHVY